MRERRQASFAIVMIVVPRTGRNIHTPYSFSGRARHAIITWRTLPSFITHPLRLSPWSCAIPYSFTGSIPQTASFIHSYDKFHSDRDSVGNEQDRTLFASQATRRNSVAGYVTRSPLFSDSARSCKGTPHSAGLHTAFRTTWETIEWITLSSHTRRYSSAL